MEYNFHNEFGRRSPAMPRGGDWHHNAPLPYPPSSYPLQPRLPPPPHRPQFLGRPELNMGLQPPRLPYFSRDFPPPPLPINTSRPNLAENLEFFVQSHTPGSSPLHPRAGSVLEPPGSLPSYSELEAKYRLLKNEHLRAAAELKSLRSQAGGGRRPGSGGVPWSHDALDDDVETSGEDEQASDHDEG